jgi:hypothetical protein
MELRSFGKIWRVDSGHIPDLFTGTIEVTEKVDGSQFSFGIDSSGELVMRSKGQAITPGTEQGLFTPAVAWVLENENGIRSILDECNGVFVYGETLCAPRHNILEYERVPNGNIVVFGVVDDVGYRKHSMICDIAEYLGLEVVPLLYTGENPGMEALEKLLEQDSFLGGTKVEGIVIKNHGQPIAMGEKVFPSMAKVVRDDFKEVHGKEWKIRNTPSGRVDLLVESFRSIGRWEKAVQRLTEAGELEGIPRDIGKLLPAVEADLVEEEKENIKETLWHIFGGRIIQRAKVGLPEWYKGQLGERDNV